MQVFPAVMATRDRIELQLAFMLMLEPGREGLADLGGGKYYSLRKESFDS